jgi:hypothetical protein
MSTAQDPQVNEDELNQDVTNVEAPEAEVQEDLKGEAEQANEDSSDEDDSKEQSLSRRQRAAMRREAELQAMKAELELLKKLAFKGAGVEQIHQPDEREPQLEDFDGKSLADYIKARDEYRDRKMQEQISTETRTALAQERQKAALEAKIREARKTLTDWDEVMQEAAEENVMVERDTAEFIAESDAGAHIAYYLAKNPTEHERLNKLSATRRLAELGKLEEKVVKKETEAPAQAKKVTQAPSKLSDTKGKPALTVKTSGARTWEEYKAMQAARTGQSTRKR